MQKLLILSLLVAVALCNTVWFSRLNPQQHTELKRYSLNPATCQTDFKPFQLSYATTHIRTLRVNGHNYVIAYKAGGAANVANGAILSEESLDKRSQLFTWRTDWTDIFSFSSGSVGFMGFYDPTTLQFYAAIQTQTGNIEIAQLTSLTETWNIVVPVTVGADTYILAYAPGQGLIRKATVATGGNGLPTLSLTQPQPYTGWRTTWTIITGFSVGQIGYVLFYERSSGQAELYTFTPTWTLVSPFSWRNTWENIIPITVGNQVYFMFYEGTAPDMSVGGNGAIYLLNLSNPTVTPVLQDPPHCSYNWDRNWMGISSHN